MTVAATRVSVAMLGVFAFLTLTFFVLAAGEFATSGGWRKFGGWLGLITAFVAWYASLARVTSFTFKRVVLPTGPAEALASQRQGWWSVVRPPAFELHPRRWR
jgi:succinate-acetate transporter protein